MTGRVLFDLQQGFHADVQADLDWRNFTFNGKAFDRLTIPIAYDGRRLLIPEPEDGRAGRRRGPASFSSTARRTAPQPQRQDHLQSRPHHPQGRLRAGDG